MTCDISDRAHGWEKLEGKIWKPHSFQKYNECWETVKLVLHVMLMGRDRICPNNGAWACAGITSCSGYGPPLT